MADEAPEYICPTCGWQGDEEDVILCECGRLLCPKSAIYRTVCGGTLMTIEAYREAQAQDARDAEKEDERLWGCFKPNIDTERKE